MRATTVFLTFILSVLILAACGGSDSDSTPPPTIILPTQTPRSTPLPPVNTPIVYGSEELPVRVLYVSSADADDLRDAELSVSTALNTDLVNERLAELGLIMTVEIERADDMLAVLDAVCIQRNVLAWVDAFTYAAAAERCQAVPILGVQRSLDIAGLPDDVSADTQAGLSFDIVYRANFPTELENLEGLAGRRLCRLSATDTISWVYLGLALRAENVNPISDLVGVVDVEDYSAMLTAIADSDCDAGAIPAGTLPTLIDETNGVATDDFETLAQTWPTIPHAILIAPPTDSIAPDLIESFNTQLQASLEDDVFSDALAVLVPHDGIVQVRTLDFRNFTRWLDAAGWAMGR